MCQKQQAPPSAAPQGGGASRRPLGFLLLAHILYDFSHMFGCFSVFPMIFAEKIVFPGPFCPGPISRLPNLFEKRKRSKFQTCQIAKYSEREKAQRERKGTAKQHGWPAGWPAGHFAENSKDERPASKCGGRQCFVRWSFRLLCSAALYLFPAAATASG